MEAVVPPTVGDGGADLGAPGSMTTSLSMSKLTRPVNGSEGASELDCASNALLGLGSAGTRTEDDLAVALEAMMGTALCKSSIAGIHGG